jgi:predicted DCC family thiol-disulfide oxidoreductase YuxK
MRVIYFDGYCGLCDRLVRFVLPRDRRRRYHFAPLQGTTARDRLAGAGDPQDSDTVILDDEGTLRIRSDAALAIVAGLGGVWQSAALLRLIPRPLRDAIYDWIARHRFRWFGRRNACRVPGPEEHERFLP